MTAFVFDAFTSLTFPFFLLETKEFSDSIDLHELIVHPMIESDLQHEKSSSRDVQTNIGSLSSTAVPGIQICAFDAERLRHFSTKVTDTANKLEEEQTALFCGKVASPTFSALVRRHNSVPAPRAGGN